MIKSAGSLSIFAPSLNEVNHAAQETSSNSEESIPRKTHETAPSVNYLQVMHEPSNISPDDLFKRFYSPINATAIVKPLMKPANSRGEFFRMDPNYFRTHLSEGLIYEESACFESQTTSPITVSDEITSARVLQDYILNILVFSRDRGGNPNVNRNFDTISILQKTVILYVEDKTIRENKEVSPFANRFEIEILQELSEKHTIKSSKVFENGFKAVFKLEMNYIKKPKKRGIRASQQVKMNMYLDSGLIYSQLIKLRSQSTPKSRIEHQIFTAPPSQLVLDSATEDSPRIELTSNMMLLDDYSLKPY